MLIEYFRTHVSGTEEWRGVRGQGRGRAEEQGERKARGEGMGDKRRE